MEDRFVEENVRHRLILSGISELEEHGIADFSLRRAAMGAQVSCAAPYRHFSSKEEYINEIIIYVVSKWTLMSHEISNVFSSDVKALAIEMCMANLRFRIANRHFPLALAHTGDAGKCIDDSIINVVNKYSESCGIKSEDSELKCFLVLSIICGAVTMVTDDNSDRVISMTKELLKKEFK